MKSSITWLFAVTATFSLTSAAPALEVETRQTPDPNTIPVTLFFTNGRNLVFNPTVNTPVSTGLEDIFLTKISFDNSQHDCFIQGTDPTGPFESLGKDGVINPPQVVLAILCEESEFNGKGSAMMNTIPVTLFSNDGQATVHPTVGTDFPTGLNETLIHKWSFDGSLHNCFIQGLDPKGPFLGSGKDGVITPQIIGAIFCEELEH